MPLDQYVTLGRSGLRVSPLCLGAMTFGEDLGWGTSVEESQQIIDRYLELGGNFIDTANFYTRSHSEKIIGDHIGRHPARRDRLVLATKFSGNLYPGDPNGGGSGRKSLINACENSLRRLQTDYIDLYWLHMWDANTPIDETMAALDDLVQAGKVRYLGVSDTPAWKIAEANLHRPFPRLVVVRRPADRVLAARTHRRTRTGSDGRRIRPRHHTVVAAQRRRAQRQVHATAMSGQHKADRGALVDSFLNEKTYAVIDELEVIAKAHETTCRQRGAGLGARAAGRLVHHHRGAPALAARRQPPRRRCEPQRRRAVPARRDSPNRGSGFRTTCWKWPRASSTAEQRSTVSPGRSRST